MMPIRNYLSSSCRLFFVSFILSSAMARNDSYFSEEPTCGTTSYAASKGGSSLRIIGGGETQPGEFPWLVSLQYNGMHVCGASIIHGVFMLTAAHCFNRLGTEHPERWEIVAGRNRLSQKSVGITITVREIFVHASYSSITNEHDIALLKLAKPLPSYSNTIAPICLTQPSLNLPARTPVTVIGWGYTVDNDARSSSDVMKRVDIYTFDVDRCAVIYRLLVKDAPIIPSAMVCAGDISGGKDSCQGDSGGPLMLKEQNGRWTQVGIVSWGSSCGRRFLAGVYTRLSTYRNWVENTIAENEAATMFNPSKGLLLLVLLSTTITIIIAGNIIM